jgi:IS605 OrfB family transposase
MPNPIKRTKPIEQHGGTSAFESANNSAQVGGGWIAKQKVDVVGLPAKLNDGTSDAVRNCFERTSKKRQPAGRKNLRAKLSTEHDVTPKEPVFKSTGTVGVDRNSVGDVATLADPQNGKVLHLGFNPAYTKDVWRRRKANLQSLGKMRLLHKIRNKQARRTKHENHLVSKQIVDYAAKHRRTIVVEKLENVCRGKIQACSEKSQWSFYQLLQYIIYKAALRGVMVIEADPAYTSQECSRFHQLFKPTGSLSAALIADTMSIEMPTRRSRSLSESCLSVE